MRRARRSAAARRLPAVLAAGALVLACAGGGSDGASNIPRAFEGTPRRFAYVAVDGKRFDSASTRGRVTVVLFLTSYDLSSQLAARQLNELLHGFRPRINAGAVALEPPKNALLVEAFAKALELHFPVAVADTLTMTGDGPFDRIVGVPTVVVLDAGGREVWRSEGYVGPERLEEVLRSAGGSSRD